MSKSPNGSTDQAGRKQLVERVVSSRYISKSARLRDLLLYLCDRVLKDSAVEIHEQEVGFKVFGRSPDYDTAIDNIVRVHASQLRKRLDQYFSNEGRDEPWIIEIPKGNYAPVFRDRSDQEHALPEPEVPATSRLADWRIWTLAGLALTLAMSTLFLWFQWRSVRKIADASEDKPIVRLFWSQVFRPGQQTDIVLDDATLALYQELTGRTVGINEYFDRSYLRKLDENAARSRLDPTQAGALVMRRYSSYASSRLLWRLFRAAGALEKQSELFFARDYTFRGIKTNNVILLGNSRSNPWVEAMEGRLGVRWTLHEELGIYYPVDTLAEPEDPNRYKVSSDPTDAREGYCMVALLPNLGGTGKVLIISGTGGSAVGAGGDFLADEQAVAHLRSQLPPGRDGEFPYFEALIRTKSRSSLPKDVTVVLCRSLR